MCRIGWTVSTDEVSYWKECHMGSHIRCNVAMYKVCYGMESTDIGRDIRLTECRIESNVVM